MRFFMGFRKSGNGQARAFGAEGSGDSRKSQNSRQPLNGCRDSALPRQPGLVRVSLGWWIRGWWCAGTQELALTVDVSSPALGLPSLTCGLV